MSFAVFLLSSPSSPIPQVVDLLVSSLTPLLSLSLIFKLLLFVGFPIYQRLGDDHLVFRHCVSPQSAPSTSRFQSKHWSRRYVA